METIRTATGKEFKTDYISSYEPAQQIYIRIVGASMVEVATVFPNPAETKEIHADGVTLKGYTRLVAIVPEGAAVKVVLAKE